MSDIWNRIHFPLKGSFNIYLLFQKENETVTSITCQSHTQHVFITTNTKKAACKYTWFLYIHYWRHAKHLNGSYAKLAGYINSSWSEKGITLYSELSFRVLLGKIALFTADFRRANEITAVAIQRVTEEICWCATPPVGLKEWRYLPSSCAYCIELTVMT